MATYLGYFNEPEDIKDIVNDSDREIVSYMMRGFGNFHTVNDPASARGLGRHRVVYRRKTYYVSRKVNKKDLDSPDNFIDIYTA
jgi:hypothetical protein